MLATLVLAFGQAILAMGLVLYARMKLGYAVSIVLAFALLPVIAYLLPETMRRTNNVIVVATVFLVLALGYASARHRVEASLEESRKVGSGIMLMVAGFAIMVGSSMVG